MPLLLDTAATSAINAYVPRTDNTFGSPAARLAAVPEISTDHPVCSRSHREGPRTSLQRSLYAFDVKYYMAALRRTYSADALRMPPV